MPTFSKFLITLAAFALSVVAQPRPATDYDLVFRNAHVMDPANRIDAVMDIALTGDHIAAIGPNLTVTRAVRTIDASGLYLTPGLIDLHAHVFGYEGAIDPDGSALPAGTTTIVDAGGSGWRTFDEFRRTVIANSKTRVLAFINIVGAGMVGEPAESNTADMDPAKTAAVIQKNRDVIVGIKTAHFGGTGWTAIDRAVEAGRIANVPVMVDDKIFTNSGRTTREKLLVHLRPGDLHTHMFNDRQVELIDRFTGKVQPYVLEARQRGVLFDLGHGAGSFLWPVATQAIRQGFYPDTISTDLHSSSIMAQQSDMPNCMSKMLLLGMSLPDVVLRSTVNPAKAIGQYPKMGTLSVGSVADIAVLELQHGVFAFKDSWGAKRMSTERLECAFTIRAGKLVYERNGALLSQADAHPEIYDILFKNAHVIDPANHRDARLDVAVTGNRIARVSPHLRGMQARVVVDAQDYDLTPGLIDIHTPFEADYRTLRRGVTTAVRDSLPPAHTKTRIVQVKPVPGTPPQFSVEAATMQAARALGRPDLGTLTEGSVADIALFDNTGGRVRCVLTVRDGAIVWDSDGLAATDWIKAGPYTNFK